jgi:hypothetical protein
MTKKPMKRDNAYYLERLRKDHPDVYRDHQAGKYRNLSAALVAAGLRRDRNGLEGLKSIWMKASQADRDSFKAFIGCVAPKTGFIVAGVSMPAPKPVASALPGTAPRSHSPGTRTLPPTLAAEIRAIMDRRKMKHGAVMREMNMKARDTSFSTALERGTSVQEDLFEALEIWVKANRIV